MEYLDNEMDDLFRKAGEHYPLKTSDSDWDAVLGRLQPAAGDQDPVDGNEIPKKRDKNRRFFWLLLLLPLGLFSIKYFSGRKDPNAIAKTDQIPAKAENDPAEKGSASAIPANTEKTSAANSAGSASPELLKKSGTTVKDHPSKDRSANGALSGSAGNAKAHPVTQLLNRTSNVSADPLKEYARKDRNNPPQESGQSALTDKSNHPLTNNRVVNPAETKKPQAPDRDLNRNLNNTTPATADAGDADKSRLPAAKNQVPPAANDVAVSNNSVQPEKAKQTITKKDSIEVSASEKQNKKPAKPSAKKERGIYVSLLAGPDFSTVKLQSVKDMGYSFGLLLGYRFNRHISLESGVYWDKKQYYSNGKYFNKSKTNIPGSVEIRDIDGNCSMFEIPVSFRYDFAFGRKGRFFSTAGLNSYIMKKENYDYTTNDYPGWSRKVSYNNSSNNLFSILQLSAGYEYNLGKIGRIRAEPYLNIPFNGVGIGSMPISSAGLHLGITIPFR